MGDNGLGAFDFFVGGDGFGAGSLAYNGNLRRGLTEARFQRMLSSMLGRKQTGLTRFREKIGR